MTALLAAVWLTPRLPLGLVRLRHDRRSVRAALSHQSCASHGKAAISWRNPIRWTTVGGRIMKMIHLAANKSRASKTSSTRRS
jgi:hypothetical protein